MLCHAQLTQQLHHNSHTKSFSPKVITVGMLPDSINEAGHNTWTRRKWSPAITTLPVSICRLSARKLLFLIIESAEYITGLAFSPFIAVLALKISD